MQKVKAFGRLLQLIGYIVFWLPAAAMFVYIGNVRFGDNWDPLPAYYSVLGVFAPTTTILVMTHQDLSGMSWTTAGWAAAGVYLAIGFRFNFKYTVV